MSFGRLFFIVIFVLLTGFSGWLFLGDEKKSSAGGRGFGGRQITVVADPAEEREFADSVEALGTAKAEESVNITSQLTETVSKIFFDDGQVVKKGDVLVELRATEERAQLAEAEANALEARQSYSRTEDLVKQGALSSAVLQTEQRQLDEAISRLNAVKARLEDRRILAPFSGVLGLREVSEGSLVTPNAVITTIDAIETINLDFSVPERFISVLGAGQNVSATVSAYPDRMFEGVVKTVDSRVDPATRSVVVRAEIKNDDLALKPGMLMSVVVTNRIWRGASVPEEAIVVTGGINYVFVVVDGEAERRVVQLGRRMPGYVEVREGVSVGEMVVSQGTHRLGRPGTKVRNIRAGSENTSAKQSTKKAGK